MATRGINLSHQTVHNWAQTFGPELGIKLRSSQPGNLGKKWRIDVTYLKVEGRWCHLYRASAKKGILVDVYLSDARDQAVAEAFFTQCHGTTGVAPPQITTDKEPALYPAVQRVFGVDTRHRDVKYMNNCIEQDHRGIKSRYKVMKAFSSISCALIFCTDFEQIRQLFRMINKTRADRRREIPFNIQQYCEVWRLA